MECPRGYYEKDGRCVKSITIKRKGIYGKGFLSEPQSEQYSKIRKEESKEGPNTVERSKRNAGVAGGFASLFTRLSLCHLCY